MADDVIVVPLDASGLHYELLARTPPTLTAVRATLDPATRLVAAATPVHPPTPAPASSAPLPTLTGVPLDACAARLATAVAPAAAPAASPASQHTPIAAAVALAREVAALGPAAVAAVAPDCTAVTLRTTDRAGTPHTGVLRLAPAAPAFETRELPREVCAAVAAAATAPCAAGAAGAAEEGGIVAAWRAFRRAVAAHERVWAELDALDALQARWGGANNNTNNNNNDSNSNSGTRRGVLRRSLDIGRGALLTVRLCAARPRVRPAWDVDGVGGECETVRRRLEDHAWDTHRSVADNIDAALGSLCAPPAGAAGAAGAAGSAGTQGRRDEEPFVHRECECGLCTEAENPAAPGEGVDCECEGCGMHYHRYCLSKLPGCETKAGIHSVPCLACNKPIIF